MGISYVKSVLKDSALDRWLDDRPVAEKSSEKDHPLEDQKHRKLLGRLLDWYDQEMQKQAPNRYQMALDHDFYDGLQYSEEDEAELLARGQAPVVYNDVKPTIDWIIGAEKRMRVDWNVLPRTDDDVEIADVKKKILKYTADVNMTHFKRSSAFSESLKCGLSWLEDCVQSVPGEESVVSRWESWRRIISDSNSTDPMLEDARFLFRWKYVDLDIGEAMFPERKAVLRSSAINDQLIGGGEEDDE